MTISVAWSATAASSTTRVPWRASRATPGWCRYGALSDTAPNRVPCAVRPQSTAEVSTILAYASREGIPVVPFGLGSGVCGAVLPGSDAIVLDLGAMSAFRGIDEVTLIATAEPGLRGSDFEAELNRAGYSMGHFPQSIALSSVGGWVATRAAGQFSTKYGNIEQRLIAFEAVLASGAIVRTRAVPRSATGPDLRHLFLGAEGTTGVLTELTFEIHPLPEESLHQSFAFPSMRAGLEAIRLVLRRGWRPAVVRLYDEIEAGRAFAGATSGGESLLIVISEGPRELAATELAAIDDACRTGGGRASVPSRCRAGSITAMRSPVSKCSSSKE